MSDYWESRYASGGTSGKGSRGTSAKMKATLVNQAVKRLGVESILDLGCGDGYVANLVEGDYLGLDPSPAAIELARKAAPQHRFTLYDDLQITADAHMSLDVIRHLVDDTDYHRHLADLFSADRVVMVWSTNHDRAWSDHERERHWTPDVPEGWTLDQHSRVPLSNSMFYVYVRS